MRRGQSNSSVTTLELLHLPRSPGFTRRQGTSSVASTPFVKNVQDGDIEICKVHTDLNVADPLTKPPRWLVGSGRHGYDTDMAVVALE